MAAARSAASAGPEAAMAAPLGIAAGRGHLDRASAVQRGSVLPAGEQGGPGAQWRVLRGELRARRKRAQFLTARCLTVPDAQRLGHAKAEFGVAFHCSQLPGNPQG